MDRKERTVQEMEGQERKEGMGGEGGEGRKGRKERTKLITAGMCLYISPKHKTTKPQNKIKQNKNSRIHLPVAYKKHT